MRVKIIKIYATGKENKIIDGEISDNEEYYSALKRILKENRMRNRGMFTILQYVNSGIYVSEYYDGIRFGEGVTVWLSNEEIKEICGGLGMCDVER